ncbi:hypothetical protein N9N67_04445 [Bacteriovoracaceae bacterium]|nr:hypothetical protein [Bacteriovoracaceae bacterium]
MKLKFCFLRNTLTVFLLLIYSASIFPFAKELERCIKQQQPPHSSFDNLAGKKKPTQKYIDFLKGDIDKLPSCGNCFVRVLHGKSEDFDFLVSKGKLGKRKIAFVTNTTSLKDYKKLKDDPEMLLRSLGYPEKSIRDITKAREDLRILIFQADESEEIIEGTWMNAKKMIREEYPGKKGEIADLIYGVKGNHNFENLENVYSTLLKTKEYASPKSIFELLVNRSAKDIQSELKIYGIEISIAKINELKKLRMYLNSQINFNPLYRGDGFVHDPIKNKPTNKEYLIATDRNGKNKLEDRFNDNYDFYPINHISKDLTPELVFVRKQIMQFLNDYQLTDRFRLKVFEKLQSKFDPTLLQKIKDAMKDAPCK